MKIVDFGTFKRTGKIVERIPIQHTSFTPGDDVDTIQQWLNAKSVLPPGRYEALGDTE